MHTKLSSSSSTHCVFIYVWYLYDVYHRIIIERLCVSFNYAEAL